MDLDLSEDRRENRGILLALLGHALTLVPFTVGGTAWLGVWMSLGGQAGLCVACPGVGIYRMVRGDRGLWRGLVVGWLVGLVMLPVFVAVIVLLRFVAHG